jgi:DNA mismatch repair ATPase MutS
MTPLRQQYLRIKKQFPDTIGFFRPGDFYESFDDDAKKVAEACNIVLTASCSNGRLTRRTRRLTRWCMSCRRGLTEEEVRVVEESERPARFLETWQV